MSRIFSNSKNKVIHKIQKGRRIEYTLAIISFLESFVFPIPPDTFLIPAVVLNKNKWLYYALIVSISSVIGAICGYFLGILLYDLVAMPIIEFYNLQMEVQKVTAFLQKNAFTGILLSAFTPIPYKVFTITAGAVNINFLIFLSASIIGRFSRFILEGYIFYRFKDGVADLLYEYYNKVGLTVAIIVILLLIFILVK